MKMRSYSSIEAEFRRHFGENSNFSWCDFRPKFDGHLINASLAISPLDSAEQTYDEAWNAFQEIWIWLGDWANCFDEGDNIQVVVGFPKDSKPSGQIFKGELKVGDLLKLPKNLNLETFAQCGGHFQELFNWSSYTKTLKKI